MAGARVRAAARVVRAAATRRLRRGGSAGGTDLTRAARWPRRGPVR